MSQDSFISLMLSETFSDAHDDQSGADFHIRRELSKVGARYVAGRWVGVELARFVAHEQEIDVPLAHTPVSASASPALVSALSAWAKESLTDATLMVSPDDRPWMVLWHRSECDLSLERLRMIFGKTTSARAA